MLVAGLLLVMPSDFAQAQTDPLPSWNDGAVKKSITDFVARVTTQGGADFVPADERIATFDNDGTLWAEQPIYFQIAFAIDRVEGARSRSDPEWRKRSRFQGGARRRPEGTGFIRQEGSRSRSWP